MEQDTLEMVGCLVGLGVSAGVLLLVVWLVRRAGRGEGERGVERMVAEGVHPVIQAAELAAQRHTGRNLGGSVEVEWRPGQAFEIDASARYLLAHGEAVGVRVKRRKQLPTGG